MSIDNYGSFGRYPNHKPSEVKRVFWRDEIPDLSQFDKPVLPYGLGKSYGDSCQNDDGVIIDMRGLNKFISFDTEKGLFKCEAGVTLAEVLKFIVPRGWFLASTPGTKLITIGGAIANDVHGKNHHKNGTFGCHVTQFELLRSSGEKLICSPEQNSELYRATIGGLGLTGLIIWAEFKVIKVTSPFIAMESIKFSGLDEFYDINDESEADFDYSVSWVDCTATGSGLGRGLYGRGNHADPAVHDIPEMPKEGAIPFPLDAPFINKASVLAFNSLYFNVQVNKVEKAVVHYNPFFYPLDAVDGWQKAYGKSGFLQYQFVIPFGNDREAIRKIIAKITSTGMSSFLTVLKTFGDIKSPGMLSFPRPGVTMAVDFRFNGEKTLKALTEIDAMVKDAGGILYPAKDARMSADDFMLFYPEWEEFSKYIDPKFSSSFIRRVTG